MRRADVRISLIVNVTDEDVKNYGFDEAVQRAVAWRLCGDETADFIGLVDKVTEMKPLKEPT